MMASWFDTIFSSAGRSVRSATFTCIPALARSSQRQRSLSVLMADATVISRPAPAATCASRQPINPEPPVMRILSMRCRGKLRRLSSLRQSQWVVVDCKIALEMPLDNRALLNRTTVRPSKLVLHELLQVIQSRRTGVTGSAQLGPPEDDICHAGRHLLLQRVENFRVTHTTAGQAAAQPRIALTEVQDRLSLRPVVAA